MSITTTARLVRTRYGDRWRHNGTVTVQCDHPGCTQALQATGVEYNGPAVEQVYVGIAGADWVPGLRMVDGAGYPCSVDLCPEHLPQAWRDHEAMCDALPEDTPDHLWPEWVPQVWNPVSPQETPDKADATT